jgi:lipoprotein NlpI
MLCNVVGADPLPEHEALRKQANDAFKSGDFISVIKLTTSIIDKNAKDNTALYMRGSARIEVGISRVDGQMIRQGITDAREALTAASKPEFNYYLPYLYGMTNLTLIEGQVSHSAVSVKIATELLTTATMSDEQKANVLYQRGLANSAGKKSADAVKDFRSAIGTNPKHLAAYMALADTYAEAKQTQQAIQAYSEAIRAFSKEPLIHNNQGMFYQKIGRPNDALRSYTAALKIDPNYHIAMTNRGFTWLEGGRAAEAQKDFTASLKMNPKQVAVYSMRGTALLVQGKWQEAVADYQTVMKLNPKDPIAHADAGFAHFFGKNYEGALTEFNNVVKIDSRARFINPWRTWTLVKLGRKNEAAGIAASSRQKAPKDCDWIDHVILYHVGDITDDDLVNQIDRTDKAIQNAQLCEARFFIAEHMATGGNANGASVSYQQAIQTGAKQLSAFRGASYALKKFQ